MKTSAEIRAQIAALELELKDALATETIAARAKVQAILDSLGMSADQLFPSQPRKHKGIAVPVKYRKGELAWSGRGRMPGWLEKEPNPEQFRV